MNLIAQVWLFGAFAFALYPASELRSDEPVDGLRAVAAAPHLVLFAGTIDTPMLECTTADLRAVDFSAGTVNYTWHLKGRDGETQEDVTIDYVLIKGTSDWGVFVINSDISNPISVQAVYSDYKSCLLDRLFLGSQEFCMLWVAEGTEDDVPEACSAAFNEKCGGGVLLYKEDACK